MLIISFYYNNNKIGFECYMCDDRIGKLHSSLYRSAAFYVGEAYAVLQAMKWVELLSYGVVRTIGVWLFKLKHKSWVPILNM